MAKRLWSGTAPAVRKQQPASSHAREHLPVTAVRDMVQYLMQKHTLPPETAKLSRTRGRGCERRRRCGRLTRAPAGSRWLWTPNTVKAWCHHTSEPSGDAQHARDQESDGLEQRGLCQSLERVPACPSYSHAELWSANADSEYNQNTDAPTNHGYRCSRAEGGDGSH